MKPVHTAELNALLLPLAGSTLLLPNAAVAEVIRNLSQPKSADNAPDWLLGWMDWRGLALPLISFEALEGEPLPPPSEQIAVLNVTSEQATLKFCALLLQGFPRPLQVDATLAPNDAPLSPLELSAVALPNGKTGKIPNLPALEQTLLAAGML